MSRTYLTREDRHQKHPKTNLPKYLFYPGEPEEKVSKDSKLKFSAKEVEERDIMHLYFVRMSRRLRSRWA